MRDVLMVGLGLVVGVVGVLVAGPRYRVEVIGAPPLYTVVRVNTWTGRVDACRAETGEPQTLLDAWTPTFARACYEP